MDLPILTNYVPPTSPADLVRHYHKLVHDFAVPLVEPEQIDVGVAFANPDLPDVPEANSIVSAALPPGVPARAALEEANRFFSERGTTPLRWVMNPSAPPDRVDGLIAELIANGLSARSTPILHLARRAMVATPIVAGVMVLPARSAYAQAEALAIESTAGHTGRATAIVQHLDEPRFDALLALRDGRAVGRIGVLAVGDLGLLRQLYIAPTMRGSGLDQQLISRALEFCSRSAFKHVLAGGDEDDAPADLLARNGFEKVGTFIEYVRPASR